MRCLNPTKPALPIGVSRRFRAAAYVHSVTSLNKLTVYLPCESNQSASEIITLKGFEKGIINRKKWVAK